MPILLDTIALLRRRFELCVIVASPKGFNTQTAFHIFRERMTAQSIKVVENDTWNCIGHSDLAFAASGTVTIEAAVLGTPMVTFYRVNALSWAAGRQLVKAPFLSMVNLIADRQIVPELIQHNMTPERLAAEAEVLLTDSRRADRMRLDLVQVRSDLTREGDPLARAADEIIKALNFSQQQNHSILSSSGRQ
jgi:lipid-A-disaccharide synthase